MGANAQTCAADQAWVASANKCATVIVKLRTNKTSAMCGASSICDKTGGYMVPAGLGISIGGRTLTLTYDSTRPGVASTLGVSTNSFGEAPGFGPLWLSNFHRQIQFKAAGQQATAYRGGGLINSFQLVNGVYVSDPDITDTLEVIAGGYRYTIAANQTQEVYSSAGQLQYLQSPNGSKITFNYSAAANASAPAAGYLTSAVDNLGRSISFVYTLPPGGNAATDAKVTSVADAAGQITSFSYNAGGYLQKITYPDQQSNSFLYSITNAPWLLTQIVDEIGLIRTNIGYDANGVAYASQGVAGFNATNNVYGSDPTISVSQAYDATANVLYNTYNWSASSSISKTRASGAVTNRTYTSILGSAFVTSSSVPSGVTGALATTNFEYDLRGNLIRRDDPQGMRSCMTYDAQNRMLVSVTGLDINAACATFVATDAVLPAGARKSEVTWHPDWALPVSISKPGSKTTLIYQGQIDPFTNMAAACSAVPVMPNGKPSPVVCKTVTQATVLATGALDATVPAVTNTMTYDVNGNVLTVVDAKNNTVVNTYYPTTTFSSGAADATGHTMGDVATSTNVLGHVTNFTLYDKLGRIRQTVDRRGVSVETTYSPRGYMLTLKVTPPGMAPRVTQYAYDATGLRTSVTGPEGIQTKFYVDKVNRVSGVIDMTGNEARTQMDISGNPIQQSVVNPAGFKVNGTQNSYDILNRLQQKQILLSDSLSVPMLSVSTNPSIINTSVVFSVKVNGANPSGVVIFSSDGTALGDVALSGGAATFATSALVVGKHNITASYSGDANNAAKVSDTLVQTVIDAAASGGCGDYVCAMP
jgi:YD repeat-containing protein